MCDRWRSLFIATFALVALCATCSAQSTTNSGVPSGSCDVSPVWTSATSGGRSSVPDRLLMPPDQLSGGYFFSSAMPLNTTAPLVAPTATWLTVHAGDNQRSDFPAGGFDGTSAMFGFSAISTSAITLDTSYAPDAVTTLSIPHVATLSAPLDTKSIDLNGDTRADVLTITTDWDLASDVAARPALTGRSELYAYPVERVPYAVSQSVTDALPGTPLRDTTLKLHDVDADGYPDLVLIPYNGANSVAGAFVAYNHARNGTFSSNYTALFPPHPTPTVWAHDVRFADFSSDGIEDIVVAYSDGIPAFYEGFGAGQFNSTPIFWLPAAQALGNPLMRLADFDNDGKTDVLFENICNALGCHATAIFFRETAPFNMSAPVVQAVGLSWYGGGHVSDPPVDLNGDGLPEYHLWISYYPHIGIGRPNRLPTEFISIAFGWVEPTQSNAFGNFTGDSYTDFVVARWTNLMVYPGQAAHPYLNLAASIPIRIGRTDAYNYDICSLNVIDFDGDGIDDLIGTGATAVIVHFVSPVSGQLSPRRMNLARQMPSLTYNYHIPSTVFGSVVVGRLSNTSSRVYVSYVDRSVGIDRVRTVALSSTFPERAGTGPWNWGRPTPLLASGNFSLGSCTNSSAFGAADFDGDSDTDVMALTNAGNVYLVRNLYVELGSVAGSAIQFDTAGAVLVASLPVGSPGASSWLTADLDGDGDVDSVFARSLPQFYFGAAVPLIVVLENVGPSGTAWTATSLAPSSSTTATLVRSLSAVDIDSDGDVDLVFVTGLSAQPNQPSFLYSLVRQSGTLAFNPTVSIAAISRVAAARPLSAAPSPPPPSPPPPGPAPPVFGPFIGARLVRAAQLNPDADMCVDLMLQTERDVCVALCVPSLLNATVPVAYTLCRPIVNAATRHPTMTQLNLQPASDVSSARPDIALATGPVGQSPLNAYYRGGETLWSSARLANAGPRYVFEDGQAAVSVAVASTGSAVGSLVADFDNDGDLDWVLGDLTLSYQANVDSIMRTLASPTGATLPVGNNTAGTGLAAIVSGDFSFDGYTDVAFVTNTGAVGWRRNLLATLDLNTGVPASGPFTEYRSETIFAETYAWAQLGQLVAREVDGLPGVDLVTLTRGSGADQRALAYWPFDAKAGVFGALRVLWNETSPCIGGGVPYSGSRLAVGDLNRDTRDDWVVTCTVGTPRLLLLYGTRVLVEVPRADGNGTELVSEPRALDSGIALTAAAGGAATRVLLMDVRGNGWLDVVAGLSSSPFGFAVWLNPAQVEANFSSAPVAVSPLLVGAGYNPAAIGTMVAKDMNGDGRDDLLLLLSASGTPTPVFIYANQFNASAADPAASAFVLQAQSASQRPLNAYESAQTIVNCVPGEMAVRDLTADTLPDVLATCLGVAPGGYFWRSYNVWLPLPVSPAALPRVAVVPVEQCGFTLACIVEAIAELGGGCDSVDLPAGVFAPRRLVLPAGRYTGCFRQKPWRIPRDLIIDGLERGAAIIECTTDGTDGTTLGGYGFEISGGVRVAIRNVTFLNVFTGPLAFGGGALVVSGTGSLAQLTDVSFINGTARATELTSIESPTVGLAAGVLVRLGARLEARQCVFTGNSAAYGGAAITVINARTSVLVTDSVFSHHTGVVSGAAIFAELTSGAQSITIIDSTFERNFAPADPQDPRITSYGGAFAIQVFGGVANVTMIRTRFDSNTATHNGGAISLVAGFTGSLSVTLDTVTLSSNWAGVAGGAVNMLANGIPRLALVLRSQVNCTGNVAHGTIGGALALATQPPTLQYFGASPQTTISLGDGVTFAGNQAGAHGGAIGAVLRGATDAGAPNPLALTVDAGARVSFSGNSAGSMGGAIALLGRGTVDLTTGASVSFVRNAAVFGGAVSGVAISGLEEELGSRVARSALGLPISSGQSSCTATGLISMGAPVTLDENVARYGALAFLCETRLSANLAAGAFVSAAAAQLPTAGGLVYLCAFDSAGCLASAAAPGTDGCCLGSRAATLAPDWPVGAPVSELPWIDALSGPAVDAALAATFESLVNGYGPIVATPPVALEWAALPPASLSTGLPFGAGTALLTLTDLTGQQVRDSNVIVSLRVSAPSGADSVAVSTLSFKGGASSASAAETPISFSDVSIAILRESTALLPLAAELSASLPEWAPTAGADVLAVPTTGLAVAVGPCRAGTGVTSAPDAVTTLCSFCTEGSFANESSLAPCQLCPQSLVPTGVGASRCYNCPANNLLASPYLIVGSEPNCTCLPGYYTPSAIGNTKCLECPEGGVCDGGVTAPYPRAGFWPSSDPNAPFIICPVRDACPGGRGAICARGYEGRLCGKCSKGFYSLNRRCSKCDDRTIPIFIAGAFVVLVIVAVLMYVNLREEVGYRFAAIVTGLTSLQIMTTYSTLELEWPPFARAFFAAISILSFNLDLSSPECASTTIDPFLLKFTLTVLLPVVALVPFAIVIAMIVAYRQLKGFDLVFGVSVSNPAIVRAFRRSFVQVCSVLYLPVVSVVMSYFNCTTGKDGKAFMAAAPARLCYTSEYWRLFFVAFAFTLLYGAGLPVIVWVMLTRARAAQRRGGAIALLEFFCEYAFLCRRFTERQYRFDVWIMVRKVAVVFAMITFQTPGSKAGVAVLLMTLALLHLVAVSPYVEFHHNWIDRLGLGMCIFTLWSVTLPSATGRNACVIMAICTMVVVVVGGTVIDYIWLQRSREKADAQFKSMESDARHEGRNFDSTNFEFVAASQPMFSGQKSANRVSWNGDGMDSLCALPHDVNSLDAPTAGVPLEPMSLADDRPTNTDADSSRQSLLMMPLPPPPPGPPPTAFNEAPSTDSASSS